MEKEKIALFPFVECSEAEFSKDEPYVTLWAPTFTAPWEKFKKGDEVESIGINLVSGEICLTPNDGGADQWYKYTQVHLYGSTLTLERDAKRSISFEMTFTGVSALSGGNIIYHNAIFKQEFRSVKLFHIYPMVIWNPLAKTLSFYELDNRDAQIVMRDKELFFDHD